MFERLKYKYNLAFALADVELATKYLIRGDYERGEHYTDKAKRKFQKATEFADKIKEDKKILSELEKIIKKIEEKMIK